MTKEFPMTNNEAPVHKAGSFGFRHYLVISASSSVVWALTSVIRAYQLVISPAQAFLFGPTGGCRFTPSCSQYAVDAVREHGAIRGSWLATKRVCRCHPLGGCGHDPVSKSGKRKAESGNIPKHAH